MDKSKLKSRSFVFTLYHIDESNSDRLKELVDSGFAKTLFFTHELGEKADNPHIQGYLYCTNANRMLNVKAKINELFDTDPNPHIEVCKGTAYENYRYITKELKDRPDAKHIICGEKPLPPGKKRDDSKYESYVSMLENGEITLKEIEKDDLAHYVRHEARYVSVWSKLHKKAVRPPTFVSWFSGTTGTGKSYTANLIADLLGFDVYEADCKNNFFNIYNGEECSIWDDYRSGGITFDTLLRITQPKGCTINVKGGQVFFNPKIQIFTSPEGVESAKTLAMKESKSLDNRFDQLLRRVCYSVNFQNSSNKNGLLKKEEVFKNAEYVAQRFLSVYKQFLIDEGFDFIIDSIPALKTVECLKVKRLIEYDEEAKASFNDNVLK